MNRSENIFDLLCDTIKHAFIYLSKYLAFTYYLLLSFDFALFMK